MKLAGKKLLVVGGAGFIGSHAVEELLREDVVEVRIFDNFSRGTRENVELASRDPRVKVFALGGDLLHLETLRSAMKGADGVFHFAALWLLHCQDFPRSAFDVNIGGTFNVLEACRDEGVKRLVLSSSASVYGDAVTEPMHEDHPFNNTNFYGATKIAAEAMARAFYHRHQGEGRAFDYVGLRYMNVYGPRQDYQGAYIAVIMKILDRLERGLPPVVYGDGSQAYDFVFVRDCARANVCAMKADTTDEFYNVGTGVRTTIKQLAELLLELTESNLQIQYEPEGQTFVKNRIGCPVKSREHLGFESQVDLRTGLQELIQWRNLHKREVEERRRAAGILS